MARAALRTAEYRSWRPPESGGKNRFGVSKRTHRVSFTRRGPARMLGIGAELT